MSRRAEDLKSQGNTCFKNKEYDKARQCYLQALKAGMEDGSDDIMHIIYSNLAHVNNKLGQFKESEKYARLTIRKKPDWFKGYHRAALAAQHLGKLDDAIALLDKGIDNCVANDDLKQLKNTILEQKRRPRSASKPPPPPPLQKVDPQLAAAAAAAPTRSSSKNRSTKASKTTKAASKTTAGETASSVSSTASNSKGVWSSLLASSRPAETVSEQTAAAARAGQPDALNEELCITVRCGSVALRRPGGAREAYDEYRKALQQVAKYPKELNLSGNELISLRYCFAMACYEVATQEALSSAEDELLAIIHKTKRPMPAAFYLLGRVYMRLNRFEQAAAVLQLASDILSKDARGDTHVYPGTSEVIPDTESAWRGTLRQPVQELLRRCQYPPRPDALCRLDDCLTHVTVPDLHNPKRSRQERRTAIYYGDVDFAGFIRVQCLSRCRLEYHLACWRQLKERFGSETQRTADKDLLNTPCLTPDCGSNICRIVTIDANGLEKHEIVSDEYKRQQQKQPQKQLSKQQKKQAAQAAKKHQVAKAGRKRKDSVPQQSTETDTSSQKQPTESAPESAGAAAAAPAAAPVEPELALPPDLREMTVLRRGSNAEEPPAPVGKKSKKKKKKGGTRGWRSATEMFWETTGPEEVYNGPPVNVIYNTSQDDLASRLCQLEDMRTLQFSTRSLIPDTSVQPASVPRDDQSGEEEHAFLESAYQYLYDFLKERGPTNVSDPELLEAVSQLPSYCQELIAQHGSLEAFLTRLPRFYQLDDLVSVEVDVGLAEALLGSAIAERVRAVDTPPPQLDEAECDLVGLGGVSNADTAELEPRSDPEDTDPESEDEEGRVDEEREDGGECETAAQTQNGDSVQSESAERDSGTADPEDSELADPEDLDAGDPDSTMDLDGDSAEPEPEPDSTALDGSEGLARDASGGGARGDGAWNTDPELSDDGQESLSQSEHSTGTDQVAQLKQQIEALKREKNSATKRIALKDFRCPRTNLTESAPYRLGPDTDQSQLQQQQQEEAAPAAVPEGVSEPTPAADAPAPVSYNALFPALPDSGTEASGPTPGQSDPWAQRIRVGTSSVTQVFHVPAEQHKSDSKFDEDSYYTRFSDIMQKTGTNIEAYTGRDGSVTFMISGKQEQVLRAKRHILEDLQTQATRSITIPKEHHGFILGRGGQRLRDLETQTATKIQVPGQADPSDKITVSGVKESVEKAVHELQMISDEQSKQAYEKLKFPKKYHPFIRGVHNENISRMQNENPGIRINMPPLSVRKDELTITGEKEGVMRAKQQILAIYEEMQRTCTCVSVEVMKSQHKYLIGPRGNNIAEILQKTGVFVEVPPTDSTSDTITLRGPQDKLGQALTMVYDKANSMVMTEVDAPVWCHKYIIGEKGADIDAITADIPNIHVELDTGSSKVKIEGPMEDVKKAGERIAARVKELEDSMCVEELDLPNKYHKHIIGKAGANISRVKAEHGVHVAIPENEASTIFKIEGPKEGVFSAKAELLDMKNKMEKQKERDIIIESRFHRQIIGKLGENTAQIRQQFDQVQVVFPQQGEKSDVVKIRGPKEMVDQSYKHLQKLVKGLMKSGYQERVSINKQHHMYIIGKGGVNIRKIRDETNTQIDLPDESSESSEIVITGRKEDVLAARDRIQKELGNIIQDINVPRKFHNSITTIGPSGRPIQSTLEEGGGVQIKILAADCQSDKVQQDEQLAEARFTQLRLERTVRQMTQRGAGAPADTEQAAAAQQLVETRQRLVETSGRLSQAEQQRAQALQRGADLSRQLSGVQQQLLTTQQQLAATEQELLATQQQLGAYQQQQGQLEAQLATVHEEAQGYMAQLTEAQQHAAMMEEQAEALASQLAQAPAADTERLHQLERQRDDEEASRRRAEAALEELRAAERRTRGQYVTMLSRAGNELLDTATRRCNDAIRGAERLAAGSGRPDSAQPTVTKLRQALDAVDQSRSQFKEAIKKACKAIASKETIDIQSLKLPEIPDIVETAINGPAAGRKSAAAASQSSAARSGASPRPSSRPSSVITVSSGSGSEAGKVSPAPTPPPAAAGVKPSAGVPAGPATAELRAPSPRRAVTPAALQLSAASRQAAPTTFDALIGEIERQFGGAVPGGRDNIIRQFTNYRRRRGGVLRGAARDQIVAEVTAMIRAEAAPAPAAAAAPAPSAWGQAAQKANGVRPEAASGAPALASIPSKEECVICRESYSTSQARTLECGHRFHELCLRRWLKAQGVMATCPICRHAFTSDTDFPRL